MFKQISRDEFFATIGQLNVHPQIRSGHYPYTSDWILLSNRKVVGRSVGRIEGGLEVTDYFTVIENNASRLVEALDGLQN